MVRGAIVSQSKDDGSKGNLGGVEMFKKLILHYQQWNRWQKHNLNSKFHKILVLLKLKHSPSFEMMKVGERIVANAASIDAVRVTLEKGDTTMLNVCKLCGTYGEVEIIDKQIKGEFNIICVCPKCKKEHERELELTRQNFRRQFGEK